MVKMNTELKTCSKCGETKPVSEFHKHKKNKDGLTYLCKLCRYDNKKAWIKSNSDKVNKDYIATRKKTWDKANQHRMKAYAANQKAAKRHGLKDRLTADQVKIILEKYPVCLACGSADNLTIDHVVPMSRGGKNHIDNIQVLCIKCNDSKYTKTIDYRPATTN